MIGEGHGLAAGTRGVGSEPSRRHPCGDSTTRNTYAAQTRGRSILKGSCFSASRSSRPAVVHTIEQMLSVPGIGYAEMGPGDLHMSYRIPRLPGPYTDPRIIEAHQRVKAACDANGVRFLEGATPDNIRQVIDDGARVISGQRLDTAEVGPRPHTKRTMPV